MIPALVTPRLLLIPPTKDFGDIRRMVDWLNDKEVVQYSEQRHMTHSVDTQWDYVASFRPPNILKYIVCNHQLIGTITAYIDDNNKVADMGIMIGDKAKWRKGYGLEAWMALQHHLFAAGIRKLEGGCMDTNVGMLNIFRKSGMRREGSRPNHFYVGVGEHNYPVFAGLEQWGMYANE